MTKITLAHASWTDYWLCICGNKPWDNGFLPCNEQGEIVDPTPEEWTTDCRVCDRCGRIIRQSDLEIVGHRVTVS